MQKMYGTMSYPTDRRRERDAGHTCAILLSTPLSGPKANARYLRSDCVGWGTTADFGVVAMRDVQSSTSSHTAPP